MQDKYFPPEIDKNSFHCPHCGVYTRQYWGMGVHSSPTANEYIDGLKITKCEKCGNHTYWLNGNLIYPLASPAPMPSDDVPEDVKIDYMEARDVVLRSPRSAAALLRLAVQKLMVELGESGAKINDDISSLVKKGLRIDIQQSLDLVRVVGNNAVHPGQMDIRDDTEIALALFDLLNIIVNDRITQPRRIQELYGRIPKSTKDAIKKRDNPKVM